jgi:hypothetical protein
VWCAGVLVMCVARRFETRRMKGAMRLAKQHGLNGGISEVCSTGGGAHKVRIAGSLGDTAPMSRRYRRPCHAHDATRRPLPLSVTQRPRRAQRQQTTAHHQSAARYATLHSLPGMPTSRGCTLWQRRQSSSPLCHGWPCRAPDAPRQSLPLSVTQRPQRAQRQQTTAHHQSAARYAALHSLPGMRTSDGLTR